MNLEGLLHYAFVVNPDFCVPGTRHHFPLMVETVSRLAYSAVNAKILELVIGSFEMARWVDLSLVGISPNKPIMNQWFKRAAIESVFDSEPRA